MNKPLSGLATGKPGTRRLLVIDIFTLRGVPVIAFPAAGQTVVNTVSCALGVELVSAQRVASEGYALVDSDASCFRCSNILKAAPVWYRAFSPQYLIQSLIVRPGSILER